jgi:hypothetical protein
LLEEAHSAQRPMTDGSNTDDAGSVDPYADTVRIRVLPQSMLQGGATSAVPAPGFDPYSTDIGAQAVHETLRRTLDDMRRLSEAIKRTRTCAGYDVRRLRQKA